MYLCKLCQPQIGHKNDCIYSIVAKFLLTFSGWKLSNKFWLLGVWLLLQTRLDTYMSPFWHEKFPRCVDGDLYLQAETIQLGAHNFHLRFLATYISARRYLNCT